MGFHIGEVCEPQPVRGGDSEVPVDEIRRLPPTAGLLAYRNRRSVLLDLAGWDARRDARAIQTGKRGTEQEQRVTFEDARRAPATPPPAAEPVEAVNEE